jgi:hypothetical protein
MGDNGPDNVPSLPDLARMAQAKREAINVLRSFIYDIEHCERLLEYQLKTGVGVDSVPSEEGMQVTLNNQRGFDLHISYIKG